MKKILILFLFVYSNGLFAQCRKDTTINGGISVQYVFNNEDSSANLKIQFGDSDMGSKEFYYDPNECSFVPRIVSKLNDSTLVFLHGKGQHYRVVTIVTNRNKYVKIETFENEMFYRNEKGDEKLLLIVDKRPYLMETFGDTFKFRKYKKQTAGIDSGFSANIYKTRVKLINDKGVTRILKYSDFLVDKGLK